MRPRSLPRNLKKMSKRQRDAICPKTVSMRQISCVFVDVCAGDHSVAHYALRADANSVMVSFDVIPKHEALRTVPKHLHHRIAYVQLDVIGLTVDRLAAEVQKAWHTGLDKVRYLHFSPDCRTLSTATAGGPTVYRMEDGTPNPHMPAHKMRMVIEHDAARNRVLQTMASLATMYPDMIQTAENPVGHFQSQPQVRAMIDSGDFRLLETHYCACADPALDGTRVWSRKPTHILLRGGSPNLVLPQCNYDCPYLIPGTKRHRACIRLDGKSHPGQVKLVGHERHTIPAGLFDRVLESHEMHTRYGAGSSQVHAMLGASEPPDGEEENQAPAGLIAIITRSHRNRIYAPTPDELADVPESEDEHKLSVTSPGHETQETLTTDSPASPLVSPVPNISPPQPQKPDPHIVQNSEEQAKEIPKAKTVRCQKCPTHIPKESAKRQEALMKKWRLVHARYGHQSDRRIGQRIKGLKKARCEACLAAKMCRKAHTGTLRKGRCALDLVHTDLQEFEVRDLDGHKFQAIFIDDYTDRKWTYLLKNKSDFSEMFKLWMAEVGMAPARVRSDWGGEYLGETTNKFLHICKERCVWPERSAPYQSQQNGKAEKGNRQLLETARAMLRHANLGKEYWGYAVRYACYIDMHCVSKRTDQTPHERWFGYKAEFSPPVFGSTVYYRHTERKKQDKLKEVPKGKLDSPGHKAIFLGYPTYSSGCYIRDIDDEHPKPVRVTYDVPDMSFDEVTGMGTMDETIDPDEYALLKSELADDATKTNRIDEATPMLPAETSPIPEDTLVYWRAFQTYAQTRRAQLVEKLPSHEVNPTIQAEWRTRQVAKAQEIRDHLDSAHKFAQVQQSLAEKGLDRKQAPSQDPAHIPADNPPRAAKRHKPEPAEQPDPTRAAKTDEEVDDIACRVCHSKGNAPKMLLCDGCDGGYHIGCIGMAKLPPKSHGWLCELCLSPGTRIAKYWPSDKQWREGTVTMQYARGKGTDVTYDDGNREHTDLNMCKWRPLYVDSSYHMAYSDAPAEDACIYLMPAWTPKSHGEILKATAAIRDRWLASEDKEWKAITDKKAIAILPVHAIPRNAVFVPTKWAYRVKSDGSLKSRLCILGNKMPAGEFETSAPTPRMSSIRMLLAKCIQDQSEFRILDLSCAFLNAPAQGLTYLRLPPGRNKPGFAALLLQNLYGSRHGPRAWHNMLHNWFLTHDWTVNPHDPCVYTRMRKGIDAAPMHCCVHVDDIGYTGTKAQVEEFEKEITKDFKVDLLGHLGVDATAKRYLGMEINRFDDRFEVHNTTLIDQLIKDTEEYNINKESVPMRDLRLDHSECPKSEAERAEMRGLKYRTILGQIGWIFLVSRPDLGWAYKECSRFASNYGKAHWLALLRIVGYLKKTRDTHKLVISRGNGTTLSACCDADWNGETDRHLSTTGWIVFFGDSPISWCSRTQRCVTRSTCESEYVSLASLTQEVIYLQLLAASLFRPTPCVTIFAKEGQVGNPGCVRRWREYIQAHPEEKALLNSDSANAIANAKSPPGWLAEALRHVKTAFHFAKQFFSEDLLKLEHKRGDVLCADILTKGWGAKSNSGADTQKSAVFHKHAMQCLGRGNTPA
jgi:transposase InsO family protein